MTQPPVKIIKPVISKNSWLFVDHSSLLVITTKYVLPINHVITRQHQLHSIALVAFSGANGNTGQSVEVRMLFLEKMFPRELEVGMHLIVCSSKASVVNTVGRMYNLIKIIVAFLPNIPVLRCILWTIVLNFYNRLQNEVEGVF